MIRSVVGRVVASVAATALAVGVGVVAGAGTASAIRIAPPEDAVLAVGKVVENIRVVRSGQGLSRGSLDFNLAGGKHPEVGMGDVIALSTEFTLDGGDDRLITKITDHGPAGFEYVSASLLYLDAAGTHQETVNPEVGAGTVTFRASGAGWSVGRVILHVRYRAPLLTIPSQVDGGGITFDVAGLGEDLGSTSMGLPLDIGVPSIVEPFGSSYNAFGSSQDPFGSLQDAFGS